MQKILGGLIMVLAVIGITMAAMAAQTKKSAPVPVTVAVTGLHCQGCVDELQQDLAKIPGVSEVKVSQTPGQVSAKIDEAIITAAKFTGKIAAHPQAMDHAKTYGASLVLYIDTKACATEPKMCPACFTEIPKVLKKVAGVSAVSLDATGKIASVSFAKDAKVSTQTLAKALAASDFKFITTFAAPTAVKAAQASNSTGRPACKSEKGGCDTCDSCGQ